MLMIWTNTKTLNGYLDDLVFTDSKIEAQVALIGSKTIDLDEFPNIRMVFRTGISKDNLPFLQAEQRGIRIEMPSTATKNDIYEETSNFTCYLLLKMNYSNIGQLEPWHKASRDALHGKEILIIGRGNIGKRVEEKMRCFMNVITFDCIEQDKGDIFNLLPSADFVSIHIPNSPENASYIDGTKLRAMKDGAVLVNTARGPLVDEESLYNELKCGRLRAAFDVYWNEPYQGKLKEFYPERFFMTPHVASTCREFLKACEIDFRKCIMEIENA